MKQLLVTILLLSLLSCDRYADVDKKELQQFFSDLIIADSIKSGYYLIANIDEWNTFELTISDTTYKRANSDIIKDGMWTYQLFGNAKVITLDEYHKMEKKPAGAPPYYRFSLPFYSNDRQSVFMYYSHDSVTLNKDRWLNQYKKLNGNWVLVNSSFVPGS
ncbi:hypothetical protein A3860_30175 [Niastella vici]|uniref:Lipoprotein n=1 Tax=Niastella vici TaxID=1703345 RepID=A0A1V9FUF3_9BACT|nr:hypothetical protein [Niastella vici]OQP61961.1 hypothetical protein A3860_30175 [Niastella vici]